MVMIVGCCYTGVRAEMAAREAELEAQCEVAVGRERALALTLEERGAALEMENELLTEEKQILAPLVRSKRVEIEACRESLARSEEALARSEGSLARRDAEVSALSEGAAAAVGRRFPSKLSVDP
jgi:hypothetical protein